MKRKNKVKKILLIISCGIILMSIEYVVSIGLRYLENVKSYDLYSNLKSVLRGRGEIAVIRLILYFPLWIFAMYLLYNKIYYSKRPFLLLAFINCIMYILISVIMSIIFSAVSLFTYSFFYQLIIATFLSPLIISIIVNVSKRLLSFKR